MSAQRRPSSASARPGLPPERPTSAKLPRKPRPNSAPLSRRNPAYDRSMGGWKARLATIDAAAEREGLAAVAEEGAAVRSPVTQSPSMPEPRGVHARPQSAEVRPRSADPKRRPHTRPRSADSRPPSAGSSRPRSAERQRSAERAWLPQVAAEWSPTHVPKQRFRSQWLRCVGAYRDLQVEFPDALDLPADTPPTPYCLARHLALLDMLVDLAKEAGEAPGCSQDEHGMLCAIRRTCLSGLFLPEPDAASLDEIRGLAEYEGRRLACARVGMVEMQLSHLSAEREEARQRAAEMERAVDESEVAQAQLRSRYSRL